MEREEVVVERDDAIEELHPQMQELIKGKKKEHGRPIQEMFNLDHHFKGGFECGINVNSFELNPKLIHMVQQNQFGVGAMEEPNAHSLRYVRQSR